MATTRQALPPFFQIAKQGTTNIQASDAMAAWMTLITKQTAAAIAVLPPSNVTTTTDPATAAPVPLPENVILVGGPDGTNVQSLPDPGQPDEILVSAGPGQLPRWTTLVALQPPVIEPVHLAAPPDAPTLSPEQQRIIDQIVGLLYELVRTSRT